MYNGVLTSSLLFPMGACRCMLACNISTCMLACNISTCMFVCRCEVNRRMSNLHMYVYIALWEGPLVLSGMIHYMSLPTVLQLEKTLN